MDNNYIVDYKVLNETLKKSINKYKLSNMIIQNKLYIIINKLYCETNIYILKNVLFNLGFSNFKLIYEEDLYKNLNDLILSIWTTNGVYINKDKEIFVELNNIDNIETNTLLITSNKDIINKYKNLIIYENTYDPIFDMIYNKYE